ncbi:hypothetical protein B7486_77425, partial [cyanobacterium TDX16]
MGHRTNIRGISTRACALVGTTAVVLGVVASATPAGAGIACAPVAATESVGSVGSWPAAVEPSGEHVALVSYAPFGGANLDENLEHWLYDVRGGELEQVTDTTGDTVHYGASATDEALAFDSVADLVGENPDGHFTVFVRADDGAVHQALPGAERAIDELT